MYVRYALACRSILDQFPSMNTDRQWVSLICVHPSNPWRRDRQTEGYRTAFQPYQTQTAKLTSVWFTGLDSHQTL